MRSAGELDLFEGCLFGQPFFLVRLADRSPFAKRLDLPVKFKAFLIVSPSSPWDPGGTPVSVKPIFPAREVLHVIA